MLFYIQVHIKYSYGQICERELSPHRTLINHINKLQDFKQTYSGAHNRTTVREHLHYVCSRATYQVLIVLIRGSYTEVDSVGLGGSFDLLHCTSEAKHVRVEL